MACLNGVLQSGPVGEQARNELDAELAMQDATEPLRKALETERAASPRFYSDKLILDRKVFVLAAGRLPGRSHHVLQQGLDLAETPWFKSHNTIQSLQPQTAFVRILAPTLKVSFVVDNRNRVEIRCLRVINAINGFHPKKWPRSGKHRRTRSPTGCDHRSVLRRPIKVETD